MAPSHSPAFSISTESHAFECVCVCVWEHSAHKYPPRSPLDTRAHHPKGASLMVMAKGCRCLGD